MKSSRLFVVVFALMLIVSFAFGLGPSTKFYLSFYEPDVSDLSRALGDDVTLKQKYDVGMQMELNFPGGFSLVGSGSVYFGQASATYEIDLWGEILSFPLDHEVYIFPVDLMLKYKFYEISAISFYGMGGWSWAYALYRLEYGGTYGTVVTGGLNSMIARGWTNSGFVLGIGAEFKIAVISGFAEIVSRGGEIESLRFFDSGDENFDGKLITDESGNPVGIDLKGMEYRIGISIGF
ncbi:MAG: hypothetical protein PHV06_11310 [bacterium]|nr:hypothetical protein [bacterium]